MRASNSRRIYQDIALQLSEMINRGELADGARLPSEREMALKFGASRTSIREAMLSLQASGLISIREKSRARVTPMNNATFFDQLSGAAQSLLARPRGVADFQEARMFFECGLARYAARYASPKEIDALHAALVQNKKCIGNYFTFSKTDVAFHNVLAEIPRNPIFAALNSALSEWLMKQRTVSIRAPVRGAMKQAYEGHRAMFEAIAAHDVEAADKSTAGHLEVVSKYYWKAIDSKTAGTP